MNSEAFERFQAQVAIGRRADAAASLAEFIASFADLEEKRRWVQRFLKPEPLGHKIRHELYEHVVFPVLLDGYRREDPWSLRWLIETSQNLYRAHHLWEQIGYKGNHALLTDLVRLCPDDASLRAELLRKNIDWLQNAVHEWPAGILYGHDGATLEECAEIADAVMEARQQDVDGLHAAFLADFEGKLAEYVERLKRRKHALPQ